MSRFSTIRRHKPQQPPPTSAGGGGGPGGGGGGGSTQSPLSSRSRCTALNLANSLTSAGGADSLSAQRGSDGLCAAAGLGLDRRLPGSLSEDSVTKEISDASKRNSDGKSTLSPLSNRFRIDLESLLNEWSIFPMN